jgi:hypothetical protein
MEICQPCFHHGATGKDNVLPVPEKNFVLLHGQTAFGPWHTELFAHPFRITRCRSLERNERKSAGRREAIFLRQKMKTESSPERNNSCNICLEREIHTRSLPMINPGLIIVLL